MACFEEKTTAGVVGTAVAAGGLGLTVSTATGPGFFAAAVGWLAGCASFGSALGKLALCLEANGQPEMATIIRAKADAIAKEINDFQAWARSIGANL